MACIHAKQQTDNICSQCFDIYNQRREGNLNPFTIPITQSTPRGWECPKCGRVYAPGYPSCDKCGKEAPNAQAK